MKKTLVLTLLILLSALPLFASRGDTILFTCRGAYSLITIRENSTLFTLDGSVSDETLSRIVESISLAFPELGNLTYTREGEKTVLHYDRLSGETIGKIKVRLYQELKKIYKGIKEESTALPIIGEEDITAESEDATSTLEPAETFIPDSTSISNERENKEEESTTTSGMENMRLTFAVDFGVRGKFFYYKGDPFLFPRINCTLTYSLFDILYLSGGVDGLIFKRGNYVYVVADVKAGVGVGYRLGIFSAVVSYGADYTFAGEDSGFRSGLGGVFNVALGVILENRVTARAQYEYRDSTNYFNLSMGLEF